MGVCFGPGKSLSRCAKCQMSTKFERKNNREPHCIIINIIQVTSEVNTEANHIKTRMLTTTLVILSFNYFPQQQWGEGAKS